MISSQDLQLADGNHRYMDLSTICIDAGSLHVHYEKNLDFLLAVHGGTR